MKLSIITINYNNAEGLRKTIESVLCQTFTDMEYIIVDGASTDSSVDVIKELTVNAELRMAHPIKWQSEPDNGIYHAMNKGIRMAKGEYLLFLNSGDCLKRADVLEEIFSIPRSVDILYGKDDNYLDGKLIFTSNPPEKLTFGALYQQGGFGHQCTFIRRSLFDKYGLYREDFRYNSDIDFWYKTIILGDATTEKFDIVMTDYDLTGISSTENQTETYRKERNIILSHPFFQKVIPDYDAMKKERESMQIFYWIKRKKIIYKPIEWLYKLTCRINKISNEI